MPRPRPRGGKGLVTIERFLGCAESAVLYLGKPIKLQHLDCTCDLRVTLYKITLHNVTIVAV